LIPLAASQGRGIEEKGSIHQTLVANDLPTAICCGMADQKRPEALFGMAVHGQGKKSGLIWLNFD
jgi:hypothetical protein